MKKTRIILLLILTMFLTGCAQVDSLLNPAEEDDTPPDQSNQQPADIQQKIEQYAEQKKSELANKYPDLTTDQTNENENITGTTIFVTISADEVTPTGNLTLNVGDGVEWTNNFGQDVNLEVLESNEPSPPILSEVIQDGSSYSYIFTEPGEYQFSVLELEYSATIVVEESE